MTPLNRRQRTGAMLAGAIAMPVFVIAAEFAAVVLFFAGLTLAFGAIFTAPGRGAASDTTSYGEVVLVLIVALSAVALAVAGTIAFVLGWRLLAVFTVDRPAISALAGLGLSVVPVAGAAAVLYAVISTSAASSEGFFETPSLLALCAAAVVEIVVSSAAGLFAWWWAAHLMSARSGRVRRGGGARVKPTRA